MVTDTECAKLRAESTSAYLSLAQYVRTRCGWLVRQTSLPNTEGSYCEEDDAWERLQRLGLKPRQFFRRSKRSSNRRNSRRKAEEYYARLISPSASFTRSGFNETDRSSAGDEVIIDSAEAPRRSGCLGGGQHGI